MNILSRSRSASQLALDRRPSLSTQSTAFDPEDQGEFEKSTPTDQTRQQHGLGIGLEQQEDGNEASTPGDEHTPLLGNIDPDQLASLKPSGGWRSFPSRVATGLYGAIKVIVTWITAPGRYLVACFFDENGTFSPLLPIFTIARSIRPVKKKKLAAGYTEHVYGEKDMERSSRRSKPPGSAGYSTGLSGAQATAYSDKDDSLESDSPARHTRSKSSGRANGDQSLPGQRSIRIKLSDPKRRRKDSTSPTATGELAHQDSAKELVAASLKSPSSPPSLKITKFPRTPLPPRPLVPRRQPSYSKLPLLATGPHAKTLILDLDETLIHSHSKGGRFTTGHMVEVRMTTPVGYGGVTIGPQVPILYYVHKRPYCDEFLRKVSRWYNLVIFTASVQEYADPVIDWLELERKYFSARYYRQHCTMRTGAYVKDLSQVEADLSKVMIVDNSPLSYAFHEDNAIPIEGWISDPTDVDLLQLIPMLEALQYSTDVRAVLALRQGQDKLEAA